MAVRFVFVFVYFGIFKYISATGCSNAPMDVIFLLDSSDDKRSPNFDLEKQFTISVLNSVAGDSNHFGLITFGEKAHSQFYLNSYPSIDIIKQALHYMWYSTGQANVVNAIDFALSNGFRVSSGDRLLAPNVLVLLTHTYIYNDNDVIQLSTKLQERGVEMFVVLIGTNTNIYWYQQMTTNVFQTPDLSLLTEMPELIGPKICRGRGILQPWTPWTSCSASCGYGLQRRLRSCEKRHETDEDCDGPLYDDERCIIKQCTDPIDGGWSYWKPWSTCSQTCGTGVQSRRRFCTEPEPKNGGMMCTGSDLQTQNCADWSCPDCTRTCPQGGHLSPNCDVCECESVTLYGRVMSNLKGSVVGADIYLETRMHEPLTTTDDTGRFEVSGICIMAEEVVIKAPGYSSSKVTPTLVNQTHWTINVTINEFISPIFSVHPKSKTRLVGQNVTLCCKAVGSPFPTEYMWYKDGQTIGTRGSYGTLTFDSVVTDDTGDYTCSCETAAGMVISSMARLEIADGPEDSCDSPNSRWQELPVGCYVTGDLSKNSTIDVGTCGNEICVSGDLHDNGTCSEWWPDYCCDDSETDTVEISCNGFTYETRVVKSCKCQKCLVKTVLTGKAYGRDENGNQIPLRRGSILVNGNIMATTTPLGFFSFEVKGKEERIVVQFKDDRNEELLEVTKVITISIGSSSSISVLMPVQPKPIVFNADSGVEIDLGTTAGLPAVGHISIQKDSLVTMDGEPFHGEANIKVHFMDPRNVNDLEAADGQFVYEQEGEKCPLETFGIVKSQIVDMEGNHLKVNKPIEFALDADVFNISQTATGDPDIGFWTFDQNKGIWVFGSSVKYASSNAKRRLLNNMIVALTNIDEIPLINFVETITTTSAAVLYTTVSEYVKRWNGWNWDTVRRYRSVSKYQTKITKEERIKRDACFVSVSIYTDLSLKERDGPGTEVSAITRDTIQQTFRGVSKRITDKNGHVCLEIFCDSEVYVYAEDKWDRRRLLASPQQDVPSWYNFSIIANGTRIVFHSENIEDVEVDGTSRYSPVLYYEEEHKCLNDFEKNFKFRFAPATKQSHLDTKHSTNVFDRKLSWYPYPTDALSRRHCFFKVLIKIEDNFGVRFVGTSFQRSRDGDRYGTYHVGPITEKTFSDKINRAACIEFRCAGLVNDTGDILYEVPTLLEVHLNPVPSKPCRFRQIGFGLNITELTDGRGFQFLAVPGNYYGPVFGVFINNVKLEDVQNFCFNGKDSGLLDMGMEPTASPAVEFDCT